MLYNIKRPREGLLRGPREQPSSEHNLLTGKRNFNCIFVYSIAAGYRALVLSNRAIIADERNLGLPIGIIIVRRLVRATLRRPFFSDDEQLRGVAVFSFISYYYL